MTEIKIIKKQGKILGFECAGHAGFAPSGQDVVCAAISTLVGSCHLGIAKVLGLPHTYKIDEEAGFFALNITPQIAQNEGAQIVLETFVQSVQDLANTNQKFIKLKIIGG